MFGCICGKSSSKTYTVNKPGSLPIISNGVSRSPAVATRIQLTENNGDVPSNTQVNNINQEVSTSPSTETHVNPSNNNEERVPTAAVNNANQEVSPVSATETRIKLSNGEKVASNTPVKNKNQEVLTSSTTETHVNLSNINEEAPSNTLVNNTNEELSTSATKTRVNLSISNEEVAANTQEESTPLAKETHTNLSKEKEQVVSETPSQIQTAEPQIIQNGETVTNTADTHHEQVSQTQTIEKEETKEIQQSQVTQNDQSSATTADVNNKPISETGNKEIQTKTKAPAPPPPLQKSSETKPVSPEPKVKNDSTPNTDEIVVVNGTEEPEIAKSESQNSNTQSDENSSDKIEPSNDQGSDEIAEEETTPRRRSGVVPLSVKYEEVSKLKFPNYPKTPDDEALIKEAIERNDFLNKIIFDKRLDDVINAMYNKEIAAKETIIKQGEKGSHMYISAKGRFQVLIKNKVVSEFSDVRVFGELAILYNAKRLASVKALTPGRVWVLDREVYQQITVRDNIKKQDEIMQFLMKNEKLKVVGKDALQEVANLLKSEFFKPGTQIVRQGDKGNKFYIIRAGTVTITKDGEGVVGVYKKGDCFGELALLKEDCRQATVTADAPGVECLTLTRKEFVDHLGELREWEYINVRPQDSFKHGVTEHEDVDLRDLKIIKTLGVGGFGRVELVQHKKKSELVFALKYLKKIDIVVQHQREHVYNEKNIQMACKSPFIVRLYRTYKDNKYIYLLMESCLGGDLWSLLQKQKLRRFKEEEAKFIAACVLESFEYLHSRGIIYRDLKPENLLIAANGYIKLTDFGFAKKISSRGKTFTFAGTPEYVAPEIVLNRGHDRSVDYWAFGAFIFELLTGRTPFRTDDSSHMKTYNKILNGIDNVQFPTYVNLKARHLIEKLCRPIPSDRLGMQRGGIKDIKMHRWFLGFDWQKFAKCEMSSPFKPKLKSQIDTQYFDQFKKDTDIPPDETSGWDKEF